MKTRGDGLDAGAQAGSNAPLDAAQVGLGGGHILPAREQESDVDWHAGEDGLFDGGQALVGAGDFDEQVGPGGAVVQVLGLGQRAGSVVGQEGRDFERNPAVHAVGAVMHRAEQVGGVGEVFERQVEEQGFAGLALPELSRMASS